MKPIQIILIAVAMVAALGAGFLVMNLSAPPAQLVQSNAPTVPTAKVLVASEEIQMGTQLKATRLAWQDWPESGIRTSFITQETKPSALKDYAETIARESFFAGEPIREQKIVRSDSGYLSAILPAGKRAVAIRVAAETSAGGFILPNDHVDVIMSYQKANNGTVSAADKWVTEIILENVRVLAIDQAIEEREGEAAQVGDTATLELSEEQVETLAVASNISNNRLMLALRSVEDSRRDKTANTDQVANKRKKTRSNSVRLIRFGKAESVRTKY
ncbi:MAG: Flp pilus assembly protein CpaB [Ahrensia sp.]|nr:Flp pilus assembly protein CpaB [Ahrensia sp.]